MLITRRSVCVLACDTSSFGAREDDLTPDEQLEEDISKLKGMGVCQWLQCLSWRVPGGDVILVATKCDLVQPEAVGDTTKRMEMACRAWLSELATPIKVNIDGAIALTSCEVRDGSLPNAATMSVI